GIDVVAEDGPPTGPLALASGRGNLVAGALGDDLPLELREGQQHVEHQPAHRCGRIEQLGDTDQRHPVRLEQVSGGVLDPTFGSGGLVTTAIGAEANAVAVYRNTGTANDSKIVAAGSFRRGTGGSEFALARYNSRNDQRPPEL